MTRRPLMLSAMRNWFPVDVVRDRSVLGLGTLSAREPDCLVAYFDETYRKMLDGNPNVAAVVTTPELAASIPPTLGLVVAENPMEIFVDLHLHLAASRFYTPDSSPTRIGSGTRIDPRAVVADTDVVIGRNVVVEPNAVIFEGTTIGDDVLVGAGSVVGGQHLERWSVRGTLIDAPHVGGVRIGDGARIYCNAVVDRSIFSGTTDVGDQTAICSLVNVSHNAKIGRRCAIRPLSIVCGFSVVGDDVDIAPGSTISNGLTIGNGARVVIGETVSRPVPDGMVWANRSLVPPERWAQIRLDARLR